MIFLDFLINYLNFVKNIMGNYGWGPLLFGVLIRFLFLRIHSPRFSLEKYINCLSLILFFFVYIGLWNGFIYIFRTFVLTREKISFFWIPDLTLPFGLPPLSPWYTYLILPCLIGFLGIIDTIILTETNFLRGKTSFGYTKSTILPVSTSLRDHPLIFTIGASLFLPSGACLFLFGGEIGKVIISLIFWFIDNEKR